MKRMNHAATHIWVGTILVALLMLSILTLSKLGEAGAIDSSALRELKFAVSILALSTATFLMYGIIELITAILHTVEDVINEYPPAARYGTFVVLTIGLGFRLGRTTVEMSLTPDELEAYRTFGYLCGFAAMSPLLTFLPLNEHAQALARRAKGVVA